MVKKQSFTNKDIKSAVANIAMQMYKDSWRPDYIVGITRGGLVPAVMLSHYTGIHMNTLSVRLRDGQDCESNCWMAEDAFGYVPESDRELIKSRWDNSYRKNILIIDDINDTGATFNWIKNDWQSSCNLDTQVWKTVWGNTVRFATLVNNTSSNFEVDYYYKEINKAEEDVWIEFEYENFLEVL